MLRRWGWALAAVALSCVFATSGWWAWNDLTKQQQDARDELANTQSDIRLLEGRLSALERSLSANGQDAASLISNLQTQLEDLDEATFGWRGHSLGDPTMNDLNDRIGVLAERIDALERAMHQPTGIADPFLESRLRALEEDVSDICFSLSQAGASIFC